MALNSSLVRVPGAGELSLGPPGTPEPPDATTALPAAWTGLRLSTNDGVTMKRAVEKTGTEHWQQLTPARYIYTKQELTVSSVFQETKGIVLGAYFGGLVFAETSTGSKKYRAEISSVPKGDERGTLTYDYDVTEHDSPPPIAYVTTTPASTSRVRWSTGSDGTGGVHGRVETTTDRDGAQMRITFRNTGSSTVNMLTSTNTPSLSIYSVELATGSPSRRSLRRTDTTSTTRYGAQVYQVPATPWLQISTAAASVAAYLVAVASSPLPVLGDVKILPDPRIQLGDLIRVTDTVGAFLITPAWVVGIRTSGDDQGRVRQALTLRATLSPGPPTDAGLFPDPPIDPAAHAVLARDGVRVP